MRVYAVIEKGGMGSEKIIGIYKNIDKAFEVAKEITMVGIFNDRRVVEVMEVQE